MDDTLARWLELREPSDVAARSAAVTQALVDAVAGRETVRVLDLGTGTGSNVRYLLPRLPGRQHWVIADRDPGLLALVAARTARWAASRGLDVRPRADGCSIVAGSLHCEIEARTTDLCELDDALFAERDVVTASALLDLVSESWLRTLAARCRDTGAAALFALTYNGWSTCSPAEREDDIVRELLNHHQRTDKGLGGIAAGPEAAELAAQCFRDEGFHVATARTDWQLDAHQTEMQRMLVDGWADAALELARLGHTTTSEAWTGGDAAAGIDAWRSRRHGHIDASHSHIAVGHVDMAAWLPA